MNEKDLFIKNSGLPKLHRWFQELRLDQKSPISIIDVTAGSGHTGATRAHNWTETQTRGPGSAQFSRNYHYGSYIITYFCFQIQIKDFQLF